jgi:hypothetical protein
VRPEIRVPSWWLVFMKNFSWMSSKIPYTCLQNYHTFSLGLDGRERENNCKRYVQCSDSPTSNRLGKLGALRPSTASHESVSGLPATTAKLRLAESEASNATVPGRSTGSRNGLRHKEWGSMMRREGCAVKVTH